MSSTHRLSTFWQVYAYLFTALGLIFAFFFVRAGRAAFADSQPLSGVLMYVFAAGIAALGIALTVAMRRIRLTLSPTGVEMRNLGYTVTAPWSEVAGLDAQIGCHGLWIPNPTVTVDPWFALLMRLRSPIAIINTLAGRYKRLPDLTASARCLPIQAFASSPWEDSPLAKHLDRYLHPDDHQ